MASAKKIAASILSADFARLGEDVNTVLAAGADWIHFDVMDQNFVPNLTLGPMVCQSLRDFGVTAPIDVHLMVKPVDLMIERFAQAGATHITFHPEASEDVDRSLDLIHQLNCTAGLALNPDVDLTSVDPFWEKLELLLLMSVYPGFGGQVFMDSVIDKVVTAREKMDQLASAVTLQIDGGINQDNISQLACAGVDVFVMGSAIFSSENYQETLANLRHQIRADATLQIK